MIAPVRPFGLRSPASWALALLYVFTAAAVSGYAVFALHPELLPDTRLAASVYRSSFPLFAQGHIVLSALVLAAALVPRGGAGWLPAFAAVCGVSFVSEHMGTGYGIPFGEYAYTGLLGAKLGGRVPFLIPVSWFLMAVPSYALARYGFPRKDQLAPRLALSTAFLVAWDLALDPAMSFLTPYWVWGDPGAYYGMPAVNLLGWAVTGVVLMSLLEALGARERVALVPVGWMAAYWAAVALMPLGMLAAAGAWGAVALTGIAVLALTGVTVAAAGFRPRRRGLGRGTASAAPGAAPQVAEGGP